MIVRHDGSTLALPLGEMELPREPMDALSLAAPKALAAATVGHRPVLHCASGSAILPLPERTYPAWLFDELVAMKAVGA
jgi:hypothetical protein